MIQLTLIYDYWKIIALTRETFVGKAMSLLFNMLTTLIIAMDFPGGSDGKSICLQCGRPGFDPWLGKIPWRRKWQPTPVLLLPRKSHGWRSLVHGVAKSRVSSGEFFFFPCLQFIPNRLSLSLAPFSRIRLRRAQKT